MTAMTVPVKDQTCPIQQANTWITDNYPELRSRAGACFASLDPESREDAVSEVLASITASVHRAAVRGTLSRLTPWSCVVYAVRQFRQGRRMIGYTSQDVLSHAARVKHGHVVHSLDQDITEDGDVSLRLRAAMADHDAEPSSEVVRRNIDYPMMLQSASEKAVILPKNWARG